MFRYQVWYQQAGDLIVDITYLAHRIEGTLPSQHISLYLYPTTKLTSHFLHDLVSTSRQFCRCRCSNQQHRKQYLLFLGYKNILTCRCFISKLCSNYSQHFQYLPLASRRYSSVTIATIEDQLDLHDIKSGKCPKKDMT